MSTSSPLSSRRLWIAVLVAALALLVGLRYERGHGFTALTQFAADFEARQNPVLAGIPHHVRTPTGFDGQFYCQLALDPLLLDPHTPAALDNPVFRARRILVSWLTYAVGAGRPYWIVHLYPLVNVVFWLLLLHLLLRAAPDDSRFTRWAITATLFSTGTLESVRLALLDLPATYFAVLPGLLGTAAAGSVVALACACLSRETGVLAVASHFVHPEPTGRPLGKRFLCAALAVLPFLLWLVYISLRWEWAFGTRSALGAPVVHFVHAFLYNLQRVATQASPGAMAAVLIMVGLPAQAAYLWLHRRPADSLWRLGAVFSVLFLFLGAPMWELPSAACRYMIPLTIAFNLQLARETAQPRRWLWLVAGNAYSLFGVYKFLTYVS